MLRFLGIEKKIALKARDLIDENLALIAFDYDYRIDGSELIQSGRKEGERLHVRMINAGKVERTFAVPQKNTSQQRDRDVSRGAWAAAGR